MLQERELTQPVNLCLPNGRLNPMAVGWSRQPLQNCRLYGHPLRKKRWNYWCITSPTHLFSVTLSDVDYAGLPFVYFLDFATGEFIEKTIITPLGKDVQLGDKVADDASYAGKGCQISMRQASGGVQMLVEIADFGGKKLQAEFLITEPENHESLNVVVPWSEKLFQFTAKNNTLPAQGRVTLGGNLIAFDAKNSFATLDFGRGVWPYKGFWNWASFSTRLPDGRTLGTNFGAGWTDNTGSTENALSIDGRMIKLSEDVTFSYSTQDFKAPWRLQTAETGRVDLTFTPFFERIAKTDMAIIRSEVHQMIGHFDGTIVGENGEVIQVIQAVGWAEDHHSRW
jgi:hypothetical protein